VCDSEGEEGKEGRGGGEVREETGVVHMKRTNWEERKKQTGWCSLTPISPNLSDRTYRKKAVEHFHATQKVTKKTSADRP